MASDVLTEAVALLERYAIVECDGDGYNGHPPDVADFIARAKLETSDTDELRAELARTREAFVTAARDLLAEREHSTTLARMLEEKTASLAAARETHAGAMNMLRRVAAHVEESDDSYPTIGEVIAFVFAHDKAQR